MTEQDYGWPEDDECTVCGIDLIGVGSHYHCSKCGELCSMMGHRTDEQCDNARRRRLSNAATRVDEPRG